MKTASLVFFASLGICLFFSRGHFHIPSLFVITASYAGLIFSFYREYSGQQAANSSSRYSKANERIVLVVFGVLLLFNDGLIYAQNHEARIGLRLCLGGSALFSFALAVVKSKQAKPALLAGAFLFYAAAAILTIHASPAPVIDVWTHATEASDALLAGKNPYAITYTDLYRGFYKTPVLPVYPPVTFLWQAPFRALFGDVRYAFVASMLLILAGIVLLIRRRGGSIDLTAGLWVMFPVSFFVLEQAWNDSLVLMFIPPLLLCLIGQRWLLAGVLLATLVSSKQHMAFMLVLCLVYVGRRFGRSAVFKVVGSGMVTGLVLNLPWALADWEHYSFAVIKAIPSFPARPDALSWIAFAARNGITLPGILPYGIYLATLGGGIAFLWDQKRASLEAFMGLCVLMYGALFLFGKQAFCNYYYAVAGLTLFQYILLKTRRVA